MKKVELNKKRAKMMWQKAQVRASDVAKQPLFKGFLGKNMVTGQPQSKSKKSGMAGIFDSRIDERVSSAKVSVDQRLQRSTMQRASYRDANFQSSQKHGEDSNDMGPPAMNNYVAGERGSDMSQRDSFLNPALALKAATAL